MSFESGALILELKTENLRRVCLPKGHTYIYVVFIAIQHVYLCPPVPWV